MTGLSPEIPPKGNAKSCPAPIPSNWLLPFPSRTQKKPDRNTPTLLFPSPFQSPTIGTSPACTLVPTFVKCFCEVQLPRKRVRTRQTGEFCLPAAPERDPT